MVSRGMHLDCNQLKIGYARNSETSPHPQKIGGTLVEMPSRRQTRFRGIPSLLCGWRSPLCPGVARQTRRRQADLVSPFRGFVDVRAARIASGTSKHVSASRVAPLWKSLLLIGSTPSPKKLASHWMRPLSGKARFSLAPPLSGKSSLLIGSAPSPPPCWKRDGQPPCSDNATPVIKNPQECTFLRCFRILIPSIILCVVEIYS